MKKTYQQPVTNEVNVRITHHLMDPSVQMNSSKATVNSSTGDYETLSRRSTSIWDDEEE